MRYLLALFVFAVLAVIPAVSAAQGCVAIRHFSSSAEDGASTALMNTGDLTIGTHYRYFKSFRHFRGREEESDRVAGGTEVINWSHSMDLTARYALSPRMYLTATLPVAGNLRSSLYEHGREERHNTSSFGLGDARVGAGYWLLNPERHATFNVALGAALKIPTGNYEVTDTFYNVGLNGEAEVRPVDQSIQPGDGGVGFALDVQLFHQLTESLSWYGSGFYLFNPREANGVRTYRETLSPLLENEAIMSVPDQYGLRLGFNYFMPVQGASSSFGIRYEAVPVSDLLGGSDGFRRPGSVFSLEPAVGYSLNNMSLNLALPIAMVRDRPQSVTDLETQQLTGNPRHGDAAFADYAINVAVTYRFSTRSSSTSQAGDSPIHVDGRQE